MINRLAFSKISLYLALILSFVFCAPAFAKNLGPSVGIVHPSLGSSQPSQTVNFITTYYDPSGWKNIYSANLLINASLNGANCFYGYYNQQTKKFYLRNDANTLWLGGFSPGSAKTIENSFCKLDCAESAVFTSGNTLTIKWRVTFKPGFEGPKKSYLYVRNNSGAFAGWLQRGSWLIKTPLPAPQLNRIYKIKNSAKQILAGKKAKNTAIYINNTQAVPVNSFDTWLYEYPLSSGKNSLAIYSQDAAGNKSPVVKKELDPNNDSDSLDIAPPRITGIQLVPPNKDILIKIQDSPGILSYNIYYKNSLTESFWHLAQVNVPVSGNGTTQWLDNGTFTATPPSQSGMRFYIAEIASVEQVPPTGNIIINNGAASTNSPVVDLSLPAQDNPGGSGLSQMKFSNDNINWSIPEPYVATKSWYLSPNKGEKTVYVKFKDCAANWSSAYPANINFSLLYRDHWAIIDEHDTPMPIEGKYYNYTGGDRGMLNADYATYTRDSDSSYMATITNMSGSWQWGGMWYSLISNKSNNIPLDFKAVFGPYVTNDYQGEVEEIAVVVKSVRSTASNPDLKLRIELKDKYETRIAYKEFSNLSPGTLSWVLPEAYKQKIKVILWVMDRAQLGDSISVDSIKLRIKTPVLPTDEEAFLWTYSWLISNYDSATAMVQDRSNFRFQDFENLSATAKLAKVVYYAYKKGYTSKQDAAAVITKIANTLINTVPRGPGGTNTLWPHFTTNGGAVALPPHTDGQGQHFDGTEWASGDTAYAALDIITALQMIGDPQNQISSLENFLKTIKWSDLYSSDGYIGHGYFYEGNKIPYLWKGFGMETIGVSWAYASSTGNYAEMDKPPSDNGSGFIDNILYPIVFSGIDRWGNDWDIYRNTAAGTQINWYNLTERNQYLKNSGLFGLSAAEVPETDAY
ncbi:MAG: hypothetical protein WC628_06135 [Candidatus Omnitrophota bacterium]